MFTVLVISDTTKKWTVRIDALKKKKKKEYIHKISYCAVRGREILEVEGRAGEREWKWRGGGEVWLLDIPTAFPVRVSSETMPGMSVTTDLVLLQITLQAQQCSNRRPSPQSACAGTNLWAWWSQRLLNCFKCISVHYTLHSLRTGHHPDAQKRWSVFWVTKAVIKKKRKDEWLVRLASSAEVNVLLLSTDFL